MEETGLENLVRERKGREGSEEARCGKDEQGSTILETPILFGSFFSCQGDRLQSKLESYGAHYGHFAKGI